MCAMKFSGVRVLHYAKPILFLCSCIRDAFGDVLCCCVALLSAFAIQILYVCYL